MEGLGLVAALLVMVVGMVLIVAQLRMFSVDATLKEILEELRELRRQGGRSPGDAKLLGGDLGPNKDLPFGRWR